MLWLIQNCNCQFIPLLNTNKFIQQQHHEQDLHTPNLMFRNLHLLTRINQRHYHFHIGVCSLISWNIFPQHPGMAVQQTSSDDRIFHIRSNVFKEYPRYYILDPPPTWPIGRHVYWVDDCRIVEKWTKLIDQFITIKYYTPPNGILAHKSNGFLVKVRTCNIQTSNANREYTGLKVFSLVSKGWRKF